MQRKINIKPFIIWAVKIIEFHLIDGDYKKIKKHTKRNKMRMYELTW